MSVYRFDPDKDILKNIMLTSGHGVTGIAPAENNCGSHTCVAKNQIFRRKNFGSFHLSINEILKYRMQIAFCDYHWFKKVAFVIIFRKMICFQEREIIT